MADGAATLSRKAVAYDTRGWISRGYHPAPIGCGYRSDARLARLLTYHGIFERYHCPEALTLTYLTPAHRLETRKRANQRRLTNPTHAYRSFLILSYSSTISQHSALYSTQQIRWLNSSGEFKKKAGTWRA